MLPWRESAVRGRLEIGVLDARGRVLADTLIGRTYLGSALACSGWKKLWIR